MESFRALTISFMIHVGLLIGLAMLPHSARIGKSPKPTFVEFRKPLSEAEKRTLLQQRSIVRSTQIPVKALTVKERKARFLSEEERTVLEEQRAALSGMTANRNGTQNGLVKGPTDENSAQNRTKPNPVTLKTLRPRSISEKIENGDFAVAGLNPQHNDEKSKPLPLPVFNPSELGSSTVGEELPQDIRVGNFTALNTDRYLYYSFYARVEEQVRHRWIKYVHGVLYSYQNTHPRAGGETWVTTIEILLDKNGYFVKGIVHDPSGLKGLDLAPVHAFREANQIPNPPAEMVKDDGLIHLDYQFFVHNEPQTLFANP